MILRLIILTLLASSAFAANLTNLNGVNLTNIASINGALRATISTLNGVTLPAIGGGGGGFDAEENFEGTGYELTWVEVGTPAEDTATTGLSLEASQCVLITGESETESSYLAFTASDGCYVYFMFRIEDAWTGSRQQWAIQNNGTGLATMSSTSGPMTWNATDGTALEDLGGIPSVDTTYHCWFEYTKGTGANALIRFYVATTATKPGSPECEITTSTETAQANRFYLGTWGTGGGNNYFDKVRLSRTAPIGSNP